MINIMMGKNNNYALTLLQADVLFYLTYEDIAGTIVGGEHVRCDYD